MAGGAVLSLATVLLAGCEPPTEAPVKEPPRPVKIVTLHNGGLPTTLEVPGQIRASQQTLKAFEVGGRIIELPVKEGQSVRKGDVLARLDARDYESVRDAARARYEAAKVVAERLRSLVKEGAVSIQDLDLAERDLRTAAADLRRAEKALEETVMVADFDGEVAKILVEDFANVGAKEGVMVIQDESVMEIVAQVPESAMTIPLEGETDAEKVASVNPVVVLSALPDQEFPAEFSEGSQIPDPVTRTYEVTLTFVPPEEGLVHAGMTAKVRATLPPNPRSRSQGYPVPVNAVVSGEDGTAHVWRVDAETMTVSPVPVQPGAIVGDSVAVVGDVQAGDLIVVSGVHHLHEGQKVRAWEEVSTGLAQNP